MNVGIDVAIIENINDSTSLNYRLGSGVISLMLIMGYLGKK
ncbi:MAG: hypothetical protein ACI83B_001543 [Sediminicola sp.]|jgi:hypothetical protein